MQLLAVSMHNAAWTESDPIKTRLTMHRGQLALAGPQKAAVLRVEELEEVVVEVPAADRQQNAKLF